MGRALMTEEMSIMDIRKRLCRALSCLFTTMSALVTATAIVAAPARSGASIPSTYNAGTKT